jgi:hypothetical protein
LVGRLPPLPYSGSDSLSQKLAFRSVVDGAPLEQVPYSFFVESDEVKPLKLTTQGSSDASGAARIVDASEATFAFFGQGEWAVLTETDINREADATSDTNGNVNEEKV